MKSPLRFGGFMWQKAGVLSRCGGAEADVERLPVENVYTRRVADARKIEALRSTLNRPRAARFLGFPAGSLTFSPKEPTVDRELNEAPESQKIANVQLDVVRVGARS